MAYILHIETATKNCSVSLGHNGTTIALKEFNDSNYSHAEKLHPFIKSVLKTANIEFSMLDAVAVSKGPGSYTGLRIGVSAAKGLCFALDIPLIAIPTLHSLACAVVVNKGLKIPLLDARRLEVYSAVFDTENQLIRPVEAEIITEKSFLDQLNIGPVSFFGDGAEKCKEIIKHKNAHFLNDIFPSANEMSDLAYQKFKNKEVEDVAYFEPFYLKDFLVTTSKK